MFGGQLEPVVLREEDVEHCGAGAGAAMPLGPPALLVPSGG